MIRTLVFGTGSVGSVYTCILCRAGVHVTCVCRSNYDAVKSDGLRVRSTIFGEMQANPTVVQSVTKAVSLSERPFDFVLVCTKATAQSSSAAIESIRLAITPRLTTIVLIQNGLGVERAFYDAFPETTILSGVAYLPTTQITPAVFSHSEVDLLYLGLFKISLGVSSPTAQLRSFAEYLKEGGATVVLSEDIQAERWKKVLANGAINPICALSRCRDRQLIELSPRAAPLIRHVMFEIAAVAASAGYGHVVTAETVEKQFARSLTRPYPGVEPSMMADVIASRPMEVHAILGEIIQTAQDNSVEVPRLTMLLVLLEGLDLALQGERKRSAQAKT
jgi:2-dehydropantoate 2-reductase